MQYREIFRVLGKYVLYFSLLLFIPLILALYYQFVEKDPFPPSAPGFFFTIIISGLLGLFFCHMGKKTNGSLHRRESILLVVLIWAVSALIGGLPFYLSGTLNNPLDAYFEAMSGLTTTGASLMAPKEYQPGTMIEIPSTVANYHVPGKTYTFMGTIDPVRNAATGAIEFSGVEAVNKAILFWRSFLQWIGGMGIVVLFLAVLPSLTAGGKSLYQTEIPGPTKDTITPRIKETASILWKLYLGLTIIEIVLLIWTNAKLTLFDAFCITFSTLSGGGFTVKNASIGAYNNANTEWIIIIFMIMGAINFSLYFNLLRRKFNAIKDPDFIFFIGIILVAGLAVSGSLMQAGPIIQNNAEQTYTVSSALREGFFQSVSAQTSTGFSTRDYDIWPYSSQVIMLVMMFVGGMSGSTSGGIKSSRFYILYHIIMHKIEQIFEPEVVRKLKIGSREIDYKTAMTVLVFFCIALFFAVASSLSLIYNGIDPESSLGIVACMMNNIGMAFRAAGPTGSFNILPVFGKILSILLMLLGRLEFFAVLLLFLPRFWRSR